MQNTTGLLLYLLFAVVLAASYLGIRRQWARPAAIAAGSVVASFITMLMISLSQGNSIYHAIFVALVIGGLCSTGILAMAWYFHRKEHPELQMPETFDDIQDEAVQ